MALWPVARDGLRWSARAIVALLVLLVVLSPASQKAGDLAVLLGSRPAEQSIAADKVVARTAIEKANGAWLAAFRSGNFDEMAVLYSDDASLSAPGSSEPLEGRAEIVDYFSSRRERGMAEPFLKTLDVVTMGDVAYETGTYRFTSDVEGGLAGPETGRYFVIWKAASGGVWRANYGIWTSNVSSLSAFR